MILWCDGNLVVPGVPVKKTVVLMIGKTVEYLVDKGEWKMIFARGIIELPVVHADSIPDHRSSRDELVVVVFDYQHSAFLWDTLHWAYPCTV